jgi:hypothetical protein
MRRQRQRLEEVSAGLAERLSLGFSLERVLASLLVQYAQIQLELLRNGFPQPRPKSAALTE